MLWSKGEKGKINTDPAKIEELLSRGTEEIFVKEHLREMLLSGKQLRVKLGFDPTAPKIHIGRAIILRKLRDFQKLGHRVVFIVGDFTASIGDPSDKLEKRPMLTDETIKENLKTYKSQIGKIIDLSLAEFHFNGTWLKKLGFREIAELAESFSVSQMANRRNFKVRLDKGEEVSLREFMYPLMQGYDSVAVKADVEIGGFDQLFNLKAGRVIQKHYNMKEQDVLTTKMLVGTDGRKMSSSWGNVINIVDAPNDMFGKIMALRDDLIVSYFTLCTDTSLEDIEALKKEMESGANPKDIKMKLAHEVVRMYHGENSARNAKENFEKTFSKGEIPENIESVSAKGDDLLGDILTEKKIVESKTDFKRLISEGAVVKMDSNMTIIDWNAKAIPGTYKIGKRRFVKIINT